jgi:hypothetical protein
VSYATSEIYLTEVFEKVCDSMNEYGEKLEKDFDVKIYPRTNRPDSTPIDLIGVEMNEGIFKKLKSAVSMQGSTIRIMAPFSSSRTELL